MNKNRFCHPFPQKTWPYVGSTPPPSNRFPSKKWSCHPGGDRSIPQKCRPGTWDDSVLADELDDLEDASTASTTVSEPQ